MYDSLRSPEHASPYPNLGEKKRLPLFAKAGIHLFALSITLVVPRSKLVEAGRARPSGNASSFFFVMPGSEALQLNIPTRWQSADVRQFAEMSLPIQKMANLNFAFRLAAF